MARELILSSEGQAELVSVEVFRATILRAGGASPQVQVKASRDTQPITLKASESLAKLAGQTLYSEADISAKVERDRDGGFVRGVLVELRIVESGDPVEAFDRWYEDSGRPWQKVADIEQGLDRGKR